MPDFVFRVFCMTQFVSPNNLKLSKSTDKYIICRCPTLAITGACHDWNITGVNNDKDIFADLQISKSPIGATKKSGEAL